MGVSEDDDDKNYSTVIKVDRVTRAGAEKIVEGARRAARKHAGGARATFIVAPTKALRGADGQREIEEGSQKLLPAPRVNDDRQCKATTNDGYRCSHRALQGNYGFCAKHR